jgi:PmbA protein
MSVGATPSADLLDGIELGLAVESFSGLHSGVNPVSGDFSVGANGLMIRNGELAEPVQELTLASTLQRLLMDVCAVGDDFEWLPSGPGGASMLIDGVAVSGT